MSYQVDWIASPNFTPGWQANSVWGKPRTKEIVIGHWWGDPALKPTYDGVVRHFKNSGSQVSAHYVVGQGKMCQMVDENDGAWHSRQANPFSIGIEVDPNPNDDTYNRVGWLVYHIRSRLGNLPLKGHREYVNTQCPGTLDLARINQIAANYAAPPPQQPEWVNNFKATPHRRLRVIAPETPVLDLRDPNKALKWLAHGTEIDFVAKTSVAGHTYLISRFSADNGLPNGIREWEVGDIPAPTPPPPPPPLPKPGDDVTDIPDVKMYAQVKTHLVNLVDGRVEQAYDRGQSFDISAKAIYLDKEYYITVYSFSKKIWKGIPAGDLAMTPPADVPPVPSPTPHDELVEQFKLLETIVNKIKELLNKLSNKGK